MPRGGAREGAGRPAGAKNKTVNPKGQRAGHQVRAYDDEWALIKEFASLVKLHGVAKGEQAIKYFPEL